MTVQNQAEWVGRLGEACKAASLRKVANTLSFDASIISRVLSGKHKGTARLEKAVNEFFPATAVKTVREKSAMASAKEAWDGHVPLFVKKLAAACDETSQAQVAAKICKSEALVSQCLRRKYKGKYQRISDWVNIALTDSMKCPSSGWNITGRRCLLWQATLFGQGNPTRPNCQKCPNFINQCDFKDRNDPRNLALIRGLQRK